MAVLAASIFHYLQALDRPQSKRSMPQPRVLASRARDRPGGAAGAPPRDAARVRRARPAGEAGGEVEGPPAHEPDGERARGDAAARRSKLEPGAFAHGVWGAARGKLRGKSVGRRGDGAEAGDPVPRRRRGPGGQGHQLRRPPRRGDPVELAERYDAEGADELVFLDITASHEKRETITELARRTADNVFIPFTIGGGIRSVADAQAVLDAGADKVAVNSSALARPGADLRARGRLRLAVRGRRDRRASGAAARLRRLRQRRPHAGRGPRGGRLGARGDRARGGGGAADQHGPRRDHRRLRPRAHPRGRRRGRRCR